MNMIVFRKNPITDLKLNWKQEASRKLGQRNHGIDEIFKNNINFCWELTTDIEGRLSSTEKRRLLIKKGKIDNLCALWARAEREAGMKELNFGSV